MKRKRKMKMKSRRKRRIYVMKTQHELMINVQIV